MASHSHSWIQHIHLRDRRNIYIALTAPVVVTFAVRAISYYAKSALFNHYTRPTIYRAPSSQVPQLSEDSSDHPYPPDALPGGRDITTPYGNIRAYEWGPEDGRKVLFVHGISTPCIALARLADGLVRHGGCRVMLFDLFGRGYSDAPDPTVHRQDTALFSAQILAVLASSPLHWARFTLVGYSFGGGVAAAFTSLFPDVVETLVFIAPGGIIRPERISRGSKFMYSGFLPGSVARFWIGRRLRGVGFPTMTLPEGERVGVVEAMPHETGDTAAGYIFAKNSESSIFEGRPDASPATAVDWQVAEHPGFVPAFISSMQYGPIHDGHDYWRQIGKRCETQRTFKRTGFEIRGLREGRVLLLLGMQDLVILADETAEDAAASLGRENVCILKLEGGHDLPIARSETCVDAMLDFWNSG